MRVLQKAKKVVAESLQDCGLQGILVKSRYFVR